MLWVQTVQYVETRGAEKLFEKDKKLSVSELKYHK